MKLVTPYGSFAFSDDGVWLKVVYNATANIRVRVVTLARKEASREASFELVPGRTEKVWPLPKPKTVPPGSDLRLKVTLNSPDGGLIQEKEWCIHQGAESLAEGAD